MKENQRSQEKQGVEKFFGRYAYRYALLKKQLDSKSIHNFSKNG